MKKLLTALMVVLLLVGCQKKDEEFDENLKKYATYWKSLINENQFATKSRKFNIEAELDKEGTTYSYYVLVNDPKVAMYDVEILVIENKEPFNMDETLPSAGIFESPFNLVPNQIDVDLGYRDGVILGRKLLEKPKVTLQVVVSWKNATRVETYREAFEFELVYEEPIIEPEVEKPAGE